MEHIKITPVHRHVGRQRFADRRPVQTNACQDANEDARWTLLDLVRVCRDRLGLRDRDITVLRGLLSLVPVTARGHEMVVFASNRVLIERCDGIDERTLRRRIEQLRKSGLLVRRQSPNGKRYRIRDEDAESILTYGIDLAPLFAIRDHLTALAEQCRRDALKCKMLRSTIRDMLFHHRHHLPTELADVATRSLRRLLSVEELESLVSELQDETRSIIAAPSVQTSVVPASDSQNDRHILNQKKESMDSDNAGRTSAELTVCAGHAVEDNEEGEDITVEECMALAPNAAAFAEEPAQNWKDVVRLSDSLAPAIGLRHEDVEGARQSMGVLGSALAVIGMVEAFAQIREPRAYLHALTRRALNGGLNVVRMFRSLANLSSVTGHYGACIPG